jgi:hypothetical protein
VKHNLSTFGLSFNKIAYPWSTKKVVGFQQGDFCIQSKSSQAGMSIWRYSSVVKMKGRNSNTQGDKQMKYLLLIYQNEKEWAAHTEAEVQKIYQEYGQLRQELTASGNFIGGSQLHPIATASSVRVRDGKPLTTDGPFAETHEQLGGYFLVEAKNLDEALAIAARIPSAREGTIEVRPIVERTAEAAA